MEIDVADGEPEPGAASKQAGAIHKQESVSLIEERLRDIEREDAGDKLVTMFAEVISAVFKDKSDITPAERAILSHAQKLDLAHNRLRIPHGVAPDDFPSEIKQFFDGLAGQLITNARMNGIRSHVSNEIKALSDVEEKSGAAEAEESEWRLRLEVAQVLEAFLNTVAET